MTPSNPTDARYTLTELADLAGVTPRTVRYYLSQGILPAVGVAGPGAKYDDGHLARLRLIKRLQREHLPLAEIRRRLETLDDASVMTLTDEPPPSPPTDSALDYLRRVTGTLRPTIYPTESPQRAASAPLLSRSIPFPDRVPTGMPARNLVEPPPAPELQAPHQSRSQWERIDLAPDVELHIRRPLPRSTAKRVDRLIEIARDLLEEDQP